MVITKCSTSVTSGDNVYCAISGGEV